MMPKTRRIMERQAVEPSEGEFQVQKASDSVRIAGPAAVAAQSC